MKNSESDFFGLIAGLIVGLILCAVIGTKINSHNDKYWTSEAIKNNCAEYRVNKSTGETTFHWLTPDTTQGGNEK